MWQVNAKHATCVFTSYSGSAWIDKETLARSFCDRVTLNPWQELAKAGIQAHSLDVAAEVRQNESKIGQLTTATRRFCSARNPTDNFWKENRSLVFYTHLSTNISVALPDVVSYKVKSMRKTCTAVQLNILRNYVIFFKEIIILRWYGGFHGLAIASLRIW